MTYRVASGDSVIGNIAGFVDTNPLFLFPGKGLFFRFAHDSWGRVWVQANGRKRYANDQDQKKLRHFDRHVPILSVSARSTCSRIQSDSAQLLRPLVQYFAELPMNDLRSQTEHHSPDALLPPDMARRSERVGQDKVKRDAVSTFVLAILAGAFIAWGGVFYTTTITSGETPLPFGVAKLLGGLAFSLGLILVIVGGAELFTGNNLIVMAWASRRITTRQLLRNWAIVYAGNFVGAAGMAVLIYIAGFPHQASGQVGQTMMNIAATKCSLSWPHAMAAGIGCNLLVCLAIWLCMSARSVADKVLAIVFPITAFVATGMEHCVANMYFVPAGMLVKSGSATDQFAAITVQGFFWNNLIPVTIGNIIGGALLVGMVYWFVYLRPNSRQTSADVEDE